MSCVTCESYGVQLRPAVDVLVVPQINYKMHGAKIKFAVCVEIC